jgi:hypothetical protein
MTKLRRQAALVLVVLAGVIAASLGVAQGASPAKCTVSTNGRMTHPLWVLLHHDVNTHYAVAIRAAIWRKMTASPAKAYRLVNRISHARVVAMTCRATAFASPPHVSVSVPAPASVPMPTGDIPGWHQVFADNFSQNVPVGSFPSAVASTWGNSYPDGWLDTSKNGTYMPTKVVSISGGMMNLYLHTEAGVHMVAAAVPTIPGATGSDGGLLYGRYVMRFRADAVPGYKLAMLLWPDSNVWPADGEIDFPESDLTGNIFGVLHYQGGTSATDEGVVFTGVAPGGWHVAALSWLPSGVTFQLDGRTVYTSTTRVPDTPMHLVIQTETATSGPAPSDSANGKVQINWLTVYRPA